MENYLKDFLTEIEAYSERSMTREFEMKISHWSLTLNPESIEEVSAYLQNKNNDKFLRFCCFFLIFTYYRRKNLFNKMNIVLDDYGHLFKDVDLFFHIYLMGKIKVATANQYETLLIESEKYLDDYADHVGFLNQYVELCARFYELNLNLREDTEEHKGLSRLQNTARIAEKCCRIDNYCKFYVNHGRIEALLKKYDFAEELILKGIALVPDDSMHDSRVASFNLYYEKISSILAFDKATETIKRCEENQKQFEEKQKVFDKEVSTVKIDNFKTISLISTVLAFLLGGVEAFAHITDRFVIGKVMLMYSGLFMALVGFICLLTTAISYKFKDKIFANLLSILLILAGIAIFTINIIL